MHDISKFPERLHQARIDRGFKQSELATMLGISQSTYSDIENGKKDITLNLINDISKILDISFDYLIGKDSYNFNPSDKIILDTFIEFLEYKKKRNNKK